MYKLICVLLLSLIFSYLDSERLQEPIFHNDHAFFGGNISSPPAVLLLLKKISCQLKILNKNPKHGAGIVSVH